MTYSIKLPDGEVIRGIPDHIDPEEVLKTRAQDEGNLQEEVNNRGFFKNALTAYDRSITNIGKNIGGLFSDRIAADNLEAEERDAPLLNAPGSTTGSILGEMTAFAVPGGAATKIPRLSKALKAAPWRSAAALGAGAGLATSTPSNRLSSTALGTAGGTIGQGLSKALEGVAKGVVKTRPEAQQYMDETGVDFLPISKTAEPGSVAHKFYSDYFPAMPFGGGSLLRQEKRAFDQFRENTMERAIPQGQKVPVDAEDVPGTMRDISAVHKNLLDEVDQYVVQATSTHTPTLLKIITDDKMVGVGSKVLKLIKNSLHPDPTTGVISVKAVMQARTDLLEAAKKASGPERRVLMGNIRKLTEEVLDELPPDVKAGYLSALTARDILKVVSNAAKKEKFSPDDVLSSSMAKESDIAAAAGKGILQHEATVAARALGKEMGEPGFWRNVAVLGVGGFLAGGIPGAVISILVAGGVTGVIATKTVQQAVRGNLSAQKYVQRKMEANPEMLQSLYLQLQQMAGAQTAEIGR